MRSLSFVVFAAVFLLTAHRVPAPIFDEASPTPVPRTTKPKSITQKPESAKATSGGEKFAGAWKGDSTSSTAQVSETNQNVLIIQNGVNKASMDTTRTVTPLTPWNDLPAEYSNTPIVWKWRWFSTDLKLDGSNLRIRWAPPQLIDWSPKVFSSTQIDAIKKASNLSRMSVYTLRGDQLTREFDSQGGITYSRLK
jgi:hypothetical protein